MSREMYQCTVGDLSIAPLFRKRGLQATDATRASLLGVGLFARWTPTRIEADLRDRVLPVVRLTIRAVGVGARCYLAVVIEVDPFRIERLLDTLNADPLPA